eukprot:2158206-Rhodomonas_salina.5
MATSGTDVPYGNIPGQYQTEVSLVRNGGLVATYYANSDSTVPSWSGLKPSVTHMGHSDPPELKWRSVQVFSSRLCSYASATEFPVLTSRICYQWFGMLRFAGGTVLRVFSYKTRHATFMIQIQCIVLCSRYGVCGTELGYDAEPKKQKKRWCRLYSYATPGTETDYAATSRYRRDPWGRSELSTDIAYDDVPLAACWAMSGTELAYGDEICVYGADVAYDLDQIDGVVAMEFTGTGPDLVQKPATSLKACYTMSGRHVAYAAIVEPTQCPALTAGICLRARATRSPVLMRCSRIRSQQGPMGPESVTARAVLPSQSNVLGGRKRESGTQVACRPTRVLSYVRYSPRVWCLLRVPPFAMSCTYICAIACYAMPAPWYRSDGSECLNLNQALLYRRRFAYALLFQYHNRPYEVSMVLPAPYAAPGTNDVYGPTSLYTPYLVMPSPYARAMRESGTDLPDNVLSGISVDFVQSQRRAWYKLRYRPTHSLCNLWY